MKTSQMPRFEMIDYVKTREVVVRGRLSLIDRESTENQEGPITKLTPHRSRVYRSWGAVGLRGGGEADASTPVR